MRKVLLVLVFIFHLKGFSQEVGVDSVLTEKKNVEWIFEFEKLLSKPEQITQIKRKIYVDSNYIRNNNYNRIGSRIMLRDGNSFKMSLVKFDCECKIVFALRFKKELFLLDLIEYPKTSKWIELISERNIDEITVLKGDIASTLYGTNGRCGVIVMYSNNHKLERRIRKTYN